MPSERVQRVIDGYLDEIEVAAKDGRWNDVSELANTVLELDDTNDDAQTFADLAASRVSASTDHSDNEESSDSESDEPPMPTIFDLLQTNDREKAYVSDLLQNSDVGEAVTETLPATESDSDTPIYLSDSALMQKFQEIIPLLERELDRFASVKGTTEDWDLLRGIHAETEVRDLSAWGSLAEVKARSSDLMARVAARTQQEPESDYWRKRQGLAPLVVKQPSVVRQPGEPESDYWRKRQGLAPLRNQASATSSSSDSPPQQEESGQSWMTYILYFVVAAVIGGIILALLGASLPEGGGGNAIMRFLIIPPIIWGLVWLVGKFKS